MLDAPSDWFGSPSAWRWLGLVGLMPLLTGVAGHCPGYRLFGLSTGARRTPE
jgi:hypothetical protein